MKRNKTLRNREVPSELAHQDTYILVLLYIEAWICDINIVHLNQWSWSLLNEKQCIAGFCPSSAVKQLIQLIRVLTIRWLFKIALSGGQNTTVVQLARRNIEGHRFTGTIQLEKAKYTYKRKHYYYSSQFWGGFQFKSVKSKSGFQFNQSTELLKTIGIWLSVYFLNW